MGNGIMIEGDMPMITGKWYNPKTGDCITVRDTIFEDGNIKIIASDGRMIPYTVFENYVKGEGPGPVNKMPKNQGYTQKVSDLPPEVSSLLEDFSEPTNLVVPKKQKPVSVNYEIIEKVFNKIKSGPKIDILVSWDPYPEREITTLTEVMDIPLEEISEYCCNKYVDSSLLDSVKEKIKNSFETDKNSL